MNYGIFVLELTKKCNLSCLYCYANSQLKSNDLPLTEWLRILDILNSINVQNIVLSGGEPFLYDNFKDILCYSAKKFNNIGITTNGTFINDETIELLKSNNIKELQISIDGLENFHDKVRGKGMYQKTIKNIKELINKGFSIKTMTVLSKENIDDFESIIISLLDLGVDHICFERLIPIGRGEKSIKYILNSKDLERIYNILQAKSWFNGKVSINDPIINALKRHNVKKTYLALDGCLAGVKNFAIDSEGYLKICTKIPLRIGKVLDIDFDNLFASYDCLKNLAMRNLKGKCKNCLYVMYCGGCRAEAFALTGDILEEDNCCWN